MSVGKKLIKIFLQQNILLFFTFYPLTDGKVMQFTIIRSFAIILKKHTFHTPIKLQLQKPRKNQSIEAFLYRLYQTITFFLVLTKVPCKIELRLRKYKELSLKKCLIALTTHQHYHHSKKIAY